NLPKFEKATLAFLEEVRDKLIELMPIKLEVFRDEQSVKLMRTKIKEKAASIIRKSIDLPDKILKYITVVLANEMLGLGVIEFFLDDENLEEVVINSSKEPVWVYHKKLGWLITNVYVPDEEQIENYASIVGRRVGRQITNLSPLMDAHLLTGDRVNATLFPVSTRGNTLTIRKFRRKPWTITDLIKNNTLNFETASFLWLCVQYELSLIIGGGTAAGKTTLLNVLMPFIPPTERIVSIEQTRELNLPEFLHWVPLTTREPNPEGKGEVSMLDLLINSLRMRPDRIVVGEIRRQREAEVLFEALNTGHSVYSTLHANTSQEAFRRLTSPPINLPPELIESMPLFGVVFRHRKLKIRRLFEVTEMLSVKERVPKLNKLYQWNAREDKIKKINNSVRVSNELELFTGMDKKEIKEDMEEKEKILKWLVRNNVNTVNTVGQVISKYYTDKDSLFKNMRRGNLHEIFGKFISELKVK
ncbi:MAG: CpaF family protein, partial [Candidatus Aenigmarchaeota archaeon]|nr:CpaF family protein [Candidatus Aenigmarchaeota archaeon]